MKAAGMFVQELTDLLKSYEGAGAGKFKYTLIEPETDELRKQAEEAGAPAVGNTVDAAHFEADAERALASALAAAKSETAGALQAGDYTAVLTRLAQLQAPVDAFFDGVLVNAENPAVRANRLALLGQLQAQFTAIADIARL